MKLGLLIYFLCLGANVFALDVATLHPLLTDLVRQVGGDKVKVVSVVRPGVDLHHFRPKPKDLKAMSQCRLIFASGKGIETYLNDLKDSLSANQKIVEVGRTIPSQRVSASDAIYVCCPNHANGSIDPHWWHNVRNMERAASVIRKELIKADSENAAYYKSQSQIVAQKLRQLDRWVKSQVAQIPKKKRHLVSSHAAFGYFCKGYGFKASFVQGLSRESEISSKQLAETIKTIRTKRISAVFPEQGTNPKILRQIAKSSGAKVSGYLVADGAVANYEKMVKRNVKNIVSALK